MSERGTASTLTDRYVWSVTRHLGPDTGPDVARELRGSIQDSVEARIDAGADPEHAEREALTELGDPDLLAREYGDRPRYLVGPGVYPEYVRLLRGLLAVLLPLTLALTLAERFVSASGDPGDVVLGPLVAAIAVTVHVCFWVTLVYAVIERTRPAEARDRPVTAWDTGQLPEESPGARVGVAETLFHVAFTALVIALLTWQFLGVADPARQVQVLDPDLALPWVVLLVGPLVVEIVLALAVWRSGRWTPALAVGHVLASATWAIVTVWLLLREQLIVPDLPERFGAVFGVATDWSVAPLPLAVAVIALSVWDVVSCLRRTRR
ncbi:hypothetical protein KGD82_25565 [Nocardiopsis eucommiae]|uniref:Uncharacterized protein n=1 Tax=Nocardiopsis eucommiae TaxID=2831970 RepID=A0A975L9J9_9ACTN|nr:hypothetical protein KGD82_25565 [Nocardiopsis eucommiae]